MLRGGCVDLCEINIGLAWLGSQTSNKNKKRLQLIGTKLHIQMNSGCVLNQAIHYKYIIDFFLL